MKGANMAQRKTATVERKPRPWWYGLSDTTAKELQRLGYKCRGDLHLFMDKPRIVNPSERGRQWVYDPLWFTQPWLNDGLPQKISMAMFSEVRSWLEKKAR
jgi:hypothetical protein